MTDTIEELRTRLEAISEALADLAMQRLREALQSGAGARPQDEKVITQARRAVEKASHLLAGLTEG